MCSFLVTNSPSAKLEEANFFLKHRGPDHTSCVVVGGVTFVHNLLSITGAFTPQPFVSSDGSVVAIYNGQIYNYQSFGSYASDGEVLLPLYQAHGPEFTKLLDGEFALVIVDFARDQLILSSDVFKSKPIVYARQGDSFAVASYQSALQRLGFPEQQTLPANTTRVIRLSDGELLQEHALFTFRADQQTVDSAEPFGVALDASIEKRTRNVREHMFVGVSGGYDGGTIAAALEKVAAPFKMFSVLGNENKEIIEERQRRHSGAKESFVLGTTEYVRAKAHLIRYGEPVTFQLNAKYAPQSVHNNSGAVGLSAICTRAKKDAYKIYFSGQGADEIFADYGGFTGRAAMGHSTFKGVFPDDLASAFPWPNFFEGAQSAYLTKEEVVAGAHGIETRYPFLDPVVVQAFLDLTPALKNSEYKYPLAAYMRERDYPFAPGEKVGFATGKLPLGVRVQNKLGRVFGH